MTTWLDELRIVRGEAIWTAPFTPPVAPYVVGDIAVFAGEVVETADFLTATLTATEVGSDTPAFAGTVQWFGILAATEVADTPSFTGLVGRSGTLAVTEAGDTAAFAGAVRWLGTIAAVETTNDVAALSGAVSAFGVLAVTEAGDTAAFAGAVRWLGTIAAIETINDVAALSGAVSAFGVLAVTEAVDTANFTSSVLGVATGVLAANEGTQDTAAFAGQARWLATLAATEIVDAAAFTGKVSAFGTLAVTESSDIAAFAGTVVFPARTGTLAATETITDASSFGGSVLSGNVGSLATSEAADTASFDVSAGWGGTLAATEGAGDTFSGAVFVGAIASGVLDANENYPLLASMDAYLASNDVIKVYDYFGSDTALFRLELQAFATFALTEDSDVFAGDSYLSEPSEKYGQLEAFEDQVGGYGEPTADSTLITADDTLFHVSIDYYGQDRASFTISLGNNAVLDAYESGGIAGVPGPTADSTIITADQTIFTADMHHYPGDIAEFNGEIVVIGTFAATEESRDAAVFAGALEAYGTLVAVEARDFAEFFAEADYIRGVIAAVEDSHDTARFSVPRWEDVGVGDGLKNELQRTIWLAGQGGRVTWLENEVEDTGFLQNLDPEVLSLVAEQERITRLGA